MPWRLVGGAGVGRREGEGGFMALSSEFIKLQVLLYNMVKVSVERGQSLWRHEEEEPRRRAEPPVSVSSRPFGSAVCAGGGAAGPGTAAQAASFSGCLQDKRVSEGRWGMLGSYLQLCK